MQEEAYDALQAFQGHHWWHIGARAVYRALIERGFAGRAYPLKMLEVGCGTGGNLAMLDGYGPTLGTDISHSALLKIAHPPGIGLVQASASALPFATGSFDGVHLLGVIEHLNHDRVALGEARRVCRPNGAVMLLTSALPFLWSHHDVANQHKRRYWRSQLVHLLDESSLEPLRLSYSNFFTLLPTIIVRLFQRWVTHPSGYDMGVVPEPLNAILAQILKFEAFLIRFMPLPIGVDLVAICRPRK